MSPAVAVTKRALDVAASVFGLAVTLPIWPFIAAAIRLESPGPVFFRQQRAGELLSAGHLGRGPFKFREFELVKFRTMRADAEAKTGAVLASENDPRITKVGNFLRKTRLDELPQLWNVLKGDMSLVGPRPERPELLSNLALAIPYFEERMRRTKPGLTGLAQISLGYTGRPMPGSPAAAFEATLTNPFKVDGAEGALADDMRFKLLHDLAYAASLENFWSYLRMELHVICKTPLIMLKRAGR